MKHPMGYYFKQYQQKVQTAPKVSRTEVYRQGLARRARSGKIAAATAAAKRASIKKAIAALKKEKKKGGFLGALVGLLNAHNIARRR